MFFLSAARLCLSDSISNLCDSSSVCHTDASFGEGDRSRTKTSLAILKAQRGQTTPKPPCTGRISRLRADTTMVLKVDAV
jgi:hypothetical protein